ncbi:MAG: hypothetical protein Q9157_000263 [Trypethelium eluteriae]
MNLRNTGHSFFVSAIRYKCSSASSYLYHPQNCTCSKDTVLILTNIADVSPTPVGSVSFNTAAPSSILNPLDVQRRIQTAAHVLAPAFLPTTEVNRICYPDMRIGAGFVVEVVDETVEDASGKATVTARYFDEKQALEIRESETIGRKHREKDTI